MWGNKSKKIKMKVMFCLQSVCPWHCWRAIALSMSGTCVFNCVCVYILTHQWIIELDIRGVITHLVLSPTHIRVSAGPAPDLDQRMPHLGPFHLSEPPAVSVLHPQLSSLLLLRARDCFQRLDLIWISINRMGLPDCESYQRHICI